MYSSSTLNRVKFRQESLGISAAALARLVNISPALLSNAYRGLGRLDSSKEQEMNEVTLTLTELEAAPAPARLPSNVDDLKRVLEYVKANSISAEKVRDAVNSIFGCS